MTLYCTVFVSGVSGATTADPSDFVVSSSVAPTISIATYGGSNILFSVVPTVSTGAFDINVTLAANLRSAITMGFQRVAVAGSPDGSSEITCNNSAAFVNGAPIPCRISPNTRGVATTAFAFDYTIVGKNASILTALDNGASITFTVSAPSSFARNFTVSALVNGSLISTSFDVFAPYTGEPSASYSMLDCVPKDPRANTTIVCTVKFFSSLNNVTVVAKPRIAILLPVQISTISNRRETPLSYNSLDTFDGGASYTFNIALPSKPTGFLLNLFVSGVPIFSQPLAGYGVPKANSSLTCVTRSNDGYVRVTESVNCTLEVFGESGRTLGAWSDFSIFVNGEQLGVSSFVSSTSGLNYSFYLMTPYSSLPQFNVLATLRDGTVVRGGQVSYTLIFACGINCLSSCNGPNSCATCKLGWKGTNCDSVALCGEPNSDCAASQVATIAGVTVSVILVIAIIIVVAVVVVRRRRNRPDPEISSDEAEREAEQTFSAVISQLHSQPSKRKSNKVWDSTHGFATPQYAMDPNDPDFGLDEGSEVIFKNPAYGKVSPTNVPTSRSQNIHGNQNKSSLKRDSTGYVEVNPFDDFVDLRDTTVRNPLYHEEDVLEPVAAKVKPAATPYEPVKPVYTTRTVPRPQATYPTSPRDQNTSKSSLGPHTTTTSSRPVSPPKTGPRPYSPPTKTAPRKPSASSFGSPDSFATKTSPRSLARVKTNPLFEPEDEYQDEAPTQDAFNPKDFVEFDPSRYVEFDPSTTKPPASAPVRAKDMGYVEVAPKTLQRPTSKKY